MINKLGKTFLFLMILGLVISSCSSDSNTNPTDTGGAYKFTCVVNGAGYSNQTLSMETIAMSVYDLGANETVCSFSNVTNDAVLVGFQGKSTGTFTIDDSKNTVVVTLSNNTIIMALASGTIKVTTYGNVGGDIIGTFTGSGFVSKSNGNPEAIQITNGTFKAKRIN